MPKRTKLSPTLPREIILLVAQFVPDAVSFFAYIEALKGTTSDQGPFEALWSLGQTAPHSNLWPNLELHPMSADEWELAVQAIPAYTTVILHARNDLHRLVDRVSPSTNLVVFHQGKPDLRRMRKWFRHLAQLPVRGLVFDPIDFADRMPRVIPHLCNVWPSLTNLRRLELAVGDQPSLEAICKCIATSQIAELTLRGEMGVGRYEPDEAPNLKLEGVVWKHLVAWLESTKVLKFDLRKFRVICDDDVSMQALNRALAASQAMQKLVWWSCASRFSAPLVLPPRLHQLSLPRCTFELVGIDCILKLLPTLPHLTHVGVIGVPMSPSDVDVLASVLALSNVSYLNLAGCSIGLSAHHDSCIQRLADAFEASASLRALNLANNAISFNGVKAILAAVERRPYVTHMVSLVCNSPDETLGELRDLVHNRMQSPAMIHV